MTRPGVKAVYTYIDQELIDKVKQAASKTGLSVSAWIRVAIIEKLRRNEE